MKNDTPYPVVYEDHDGSWTWSIEVGEPFEPNHRVLATNQGYPDRKEAREALEEAMEGVAQKLKNEKDADLAERQARLDKAEEAAAKPDPSPLADTIEPPEAAESEAPDQASQGEPISPGTGQPIPNWGVFEASKLIALFSTRKLARAYIAENQSLKMRKVETIVTAG